MSSDIVGIVWIFLLSATVATTSYSTPALERDKQILLRLKNFWGEPPSLAPWINASTSPCTWNGVRCFGRAVTAIVLREQGIDGAIPLFTCDLKKLTALDLFRNSIHGRFPHAALSRCRNLVHLDLSRNSLAGPLPHDLDLSLSPRLQYLGLSANHLSGELPAAITRFPNIRVLLLDNNGFSGRIPPEMFEGVDGGLSNLENLTLSYNFFSPAALPARLGKLKMLRNFRMSKAGLIGEIPASIGELVQLDTLDLSKNQLSGPIPEEIGSLPLLTYLDLSENKLSSAVPEKLGDTRLNFLNLSSNALNGQIPRTFENRKYNGSFQSNAGLCFGSGGGRLVPIPRCVTGSRKLMPGSRTGMPMKLAMPAVAVGVLTVLLVLVLVFFVIPRLREKTDKRDFADSILLEAIKSTGFSKDNLVGGSGKVYRFRVGDREEVAVKEIRSGSRNRKLEEEFESEAYILRSLRHMNIARLLSYFSREEDRSAKLLVYEYMSNGSLHDWLHGNRNLPVAPENRHVHRDWEKRLEIATAAAKGLHQMHYSSPPVIHHNVKSSNILLDGDSNAKVANFGFAKMLEGDDALHDSAYTAPECRGMKEPSKKKEENEKTDVYGFGVVLLELVTGKQANDADCGNSLVDWAWKLKNASEAEMLKAFDKQTEDLLHIQQMGAVFKLGRQCTCTYPSYRPTMNDVLQELQRLSRDSADAFGDGVNNYMDQPAPRQTAEDQYRKWDLPLRIFTICCGVIVLNPLIDHAQKLALEVSTHTAAVVAQLVCLVAAIMGIFFIARGLARPGAQPNVPNWVAGSAHWLLMVFVGTAILCKISSITP